MLGSVSPESNLTSKICEQGHEIGVVTYSNFNFKEGDRFTESHLIIHYSIYSITSRYILKGLMSDKYS